MTGSLILSTALHVGGMLALVFGLPSFSSPPPPLPWRPVPVDIVEIGAITNTRLQGETETTAKTTPKESAPAPEKKPDAPKPEPKPEAKPEEPKVEKPPSPDDVVIPDPKAKPEKPKPDVAKKEETPDPLASVLKNVAKIKAEGTKLEGARPDKKRNDGESALGTGKGFGPALSDRLTISQEDSLRRQIGGCWNMPVGARNAEDLIVEVLIEMNEDRTVRSAEVVDQTRFANDPPFRAAAEAALRALRHPKCTPLALPEGYYEQWKTIRFNFDPRDML